jgi:hypothetical protein
VAEIEDGEGDDGDYFDALPLDTDLGDYRITGYLGRGSFGITYRARETRLKRDVAIKEYMPREWARRFPDNSIGTVARKTSGTFHYGLERFTMEAQNLAACRQENIVKVHRLLEQNATSYMVMELLEGETLETRIVRAGRLPWAELGPIFRALLAGLRDIHRRGILHRDVKPANIVLRDLGDEQSDGAGGCQPVLIDFGAAREIRRQAGGRLSTILTEEYAPLEQWTGAEEQGSYTDVYALAATISHALTGIVPTMAPARKSGPNESMTTKAAGLAPDDVLRGLDRGLMLDAAQRPQSIDEWLAEMPSLAGTAPAAAAVAEQGAAEAGRRPVNRRAVLALGGGAALAGVAAWLLLSPRSDIGGSARPLRVDWARAYDAVGPNGVKPAVAIAPDGGAFAVASVVLGEAVHMVAMKLDARGVERARWMSSEGNAQAFAVRPAPGGGVFVGGGAEMTADGAAAASGKGLLVRLDARFSQVWRTEFEGAILTSLIPQGQNELLAAFDGVNRSGVAMLQRIGDNGQKRGAPIELNDRRGDSAPKVIALANGTLAVLGLRESGPTNRSIWVSCVNSDGRELWRASDSGEVAARGFAWSEGWDIAVAGDGLIVVGRGVKAAIDTSEAGNPQPIHSSIAMRLDPGKGGAIQWLRAGYEPDPRAATASASARCIATVGASEPSLYIAGWQKIPREGWLRQLDGEGNVVWAMESMGPRGFAPTHLQLDERGGYAVGIFNPDPQTVKLMVVRLVSV